MKVEIVTSMLKIEAIIHPYKLDDVKATLDSLGVERVMITEILEHARSVGHKVVYRGTEYRVDARRVKLEMFVSSIRIDEVIEALSRAARTIGTGDDDGTVFVYDVADAVQIRSGARLQFAMA
jgi:nitrogen regulatory protein P-II 1